MRQGSLKRSKTLKFGIYLLACTFTTQLAFGQCQTWEGLPNQSDAEDAHTIYRQAIKTDDWQIAFENWQIAYRIAPAADGKRDYHFMDGTKLYLHKFAEGVKRLIQKKEHRDMKFLSEFSSKIFKEGLPVVFEIKIKDLTGRERNYHRSFLNYG